MAYLFTEILIISRCTDIKRDFVQKHQGDKIKQSGKAYDII